MTSKPVFSVARSASVRDQFRYLVLLDQVVCKMKSVGPLLSNLKLVIKLKKHQRT